MTTNKEELREKYYKEFKNYTNSDNLEKILDFFLQQLDSILLERDKQEKRTFDFARGVGRADMQIELITFKEKVREMIEEKVTKLRGSSTHGNCCTCQDCKNPHDECSCEEIKVLQDLLNSDLLN